MNSNGMEPGQDAAGIGEAQLEEEEKVGMWDGRKKTGSRSWFYRVAARTTTAGAAGRANPGARVSVARNR